MKFHIIAAKQIKECREKNCRVKFGQYDSLEEAELALAELISPTTVKETLGFEKILIPSNQSKENQLIDAPLKTETESEPKANVKQNSQSNDYFADDTEFLKGDDVILSATPAAALFEQMENIVSWRIENFYNDDGKRRGKYSLRSDPPIFRIESSDGAVAEFVLTKNLSITLAETFENVKRAHYGVNPKQKDSLTQKEAKGKFEEFADWAGSNPAKSIALAVFVVLFVITAFIV